RRRHTRFDCDWSSDVCSSDLMTPEAANFIESGRRRREKARREADDPFLAEMRDFARETGAWVLLGSLVIDPAGEPGSEGEERLRSEERRVGKEGGCPWTAER